MILGAIAGSLVLVAVLVAVAWLVLGLNLVRVEGSAMEPTLKRGTYLIIRRAATAPARGEVVAYRLQDPQSTRELMFLHRVIAVEGDTLEVRGGRVRINGTEQEEPYIIEPPKYEIQRVQVGPGQVYVLGDNRNNSADSHTRGPVPVERVVGVIFWRPGIGLARSG